MGLLLTSMDIFSTKISRKSNDIGIMSRLRVAQYELTFQQDEYPVNEHGYLFKQDKHKVEQHWYHVEAQSRSV